MTVPTKEEIQQMALDAGFVWRHCVDKKDPELIAADESCEKRLADAMVSRIIQPLIESFDSAIEACKKRA